jgi:hypothetical protein
MAFSLILAVAVFFFVMGAVALVRPERVVAYFGTAVLTRDGRNEVRAVYGGFGIAIGLLLLTATALPSLQYGVLVCVSVALVGMAAGRLVSVFVDGSPGFYPWLFFAIELVLAGVLVLALLRSL